MIASRWFYGPTLAMLAALGCSNNPPAADTQAGSESESTGESGETGETGGPVACTDMPGPWDAGYVISGDTTPVGDAEQGLWSLVHEDYVSCGIPYDLFVTAAQLVPALQGETLPWREGNAADLPYSFNLITSAGGTELVTGNCLACHAGYLNGELVLGLGNHAADYTDTVAFADLLPDLDPDTDAGQELAKFKVRTQTVAPFIQTYTVGTNPADIVAVVLSAHRDPTTLAWSDEELFPFETVMSPTDTPPWWRVGKKAGHFFTGMSRGDHRGSMMFASSLCVDDVATADQMVDYFADIRAYLASIEPPAWPWTVDEALAVEGQTLFECNCAGPWHLLRRSGRRNLPEPAVAARRDRHRSGGRHGLGLGSRLCGRMVQLVLVWAVRLVGAEQSMARLRRAAARRDLGDAAVLAQRFRPEPGAGAELDGAANLLA
jgi:hypothetical protein